MAFPLAPDTRKLAVRRSACDQCRARRVRCLRARDSIEPCARCSHLGTRCVTGATGQAGRPPKPRLAHGEGSPKGTGTTASGPGDVPSSPTHRTPALRDGDQASIHAPGRGTSSNSWGLGSGQHDMAGPDAGREDPMTCEPQPGLFAFFESSLIDQSPVYEYDQDTLSLTEQPNSSSQLQGLLGAEDQLHQMLHMGEPRSSTALDMDMDPLLGHEEGVLWPTPPPQKVCVAGSLTRFREKVHRRIAMVDAYYSDPSEILQRCKEEGEGRDMENPAASLLLCSRELLDIMQNLTPASPLRTQTEDAPGTEIVLLALSSYLALMRLFDALFHRIYRHLCQASPETYESVKVKSVLRIGGVSTLQDMPLKVYAMGILDAIQSQVQTLERCMGIPAEHCLSGQAAASSAIPGIFSRPDRARLFWTVMGQEDVQSRRGYKSYAKSIRASIRESMEFLAE